MSYRETGCKDTDRRHVPHIMPGGVISFWR